jgi:hypothetical protein
MAPRSRVSARRNREHVLRDQGAQELERKRDPSARLGNLRYPGVGLSRLLSSRVYVILASVVAPSLSVILMFWSSSLGVWVTLTPFW